jgi:putative PEP-CTERM system histidine kinase
MMNLNDILAYSVAAVTAGVAFFALWREQRSFVHRVFSAGMALLALDAALTRLVYGPFFLEHFQLWQTAGLMVASILPAVWLFFSLIFARTNYQEQVSRWKGVLALSLALPVGILIVFGNAFFNGPPVILGESTLFMQIGPAGYYWSLLMIVITVMILMNMERTFRHATGHIRWQTKFMFLGVGGIFGIRLFINSQTVLFKGIDTGLDVIGLGALFVGDLLIIRSLFRGRPLHASVQLSHAFLYNSLTVFIVGLFFIFTGVVAWLSVRFEWLRNAHIAVFFVFLALIGMAVLLLSDRLRLQRKRFVSRHFKRPQYDYRNIWEDFTTRTTSVTQTRDLSDIIVRFVSETLEILAVSIWLADEKNESLSFGGSTVFTEVQAEKLKLFGQGGAGVVRAMSGQDMPIDMATREDDWAADIKQVFTVGETKESRIRYCMPLNAAGQLIGIMTLSEKVYYEPLSFEETDLVKTIANQAAAGLFNLRLSERLRQAKELEAFQAMSAFFLHDLKNLASKLSLLTQNLPVHIDNPEFRTDAFRTIAQSVTKINTMSSRLSMLSQKLELAPSQTNLNELVSLAAADVKSYTVVPVSLELKDVPLVALDREQMHKVLENLLMNASDALTVIAPQFPTIIVSTALRDNWAEIAVRDNGCGMSKEFIEKSLFRPFQTTKKKGMGIGLYHCKTIIDAHGGRLEVDSEEGRGTTFRVLLPV